MKTRTFSFLDVVLPIVMIVVLVISVFLPQSGVSAASLTITPNTWNIIGLDSNNPASGPYRFPVGAKVCSSVATTNVVVNFIWDDNTNASDIYLRAGSLSSITIPSIAVGAANCKDAYFEVEVNRATAPYNKTRRYHITATDSSGTVSTVQPRELYVEHLISQNRNAVTDVKYGTSLASLASVAAGGTMTLMVGNTYYIQLYGGTATQGYNQFEDFINFPNTIFQMLSVSTTYSADSNTSHVPNPNPGLYADACTWDNNPNSPTYRSCIGGDDKAGGSNVVTTYQVKIISGGGTSQTLNTLLYDFSGSSYHYNADFSASSRIAYIIDPSVVTISKSFSPKAIAPGGTSVMTVKVTNPTTAAFSGLTFTDSFPSSLTLVNTTTTNTCGGSLTDDSGSALNVGDAGIMLSSGTLSANSVCTISVDLTAPAGTYTNTTGHLYVNDTIDTGNYSSDTLTASSAPACTPGQTVAHWTIPSTATNPPDTAGGIPTALGANVSSGTASFSSSNGGGSVIDSSGGQNDSYSWKSWGWKTAGSQILFKVDTSGYSGNSVSFYAYHDNAGPTSLTMEYSTNNGSTYSGTTTSAVNTTFTQYSLSIPQNNTVWVKITASGANNDNSGADLFVDNITFSGCGIPAPAPTISKSFSSPILKGSTSTLSFTLNNNASGNRALTNVAFADVLPSGLSIADSSITQCGGTLTTTAATRTIALTGGLLAAGGSCTFNVTVTGTTEGQYDNVTGYVSSTQSGTSTNYATASLTVLASPVLAKSFSPTSIFTGNTSTLTFTITNPNAYDSLSGLGFTDTLPAGLTATNGTTNSLCGSGSLVISGGNLLTFSGGSLAANANCTFNVTVTGATAGTKNNTTSAIASTEGGNGNSASASLVVNTQTASLDLTKQVSITGTDPWKTFIGAAGGSNIYYRFKVYNSGDLPFTAISVSDPTLAGTSADPTACNWAASLPLAAGDTAYCIQGPIAASTTPGSYSNTATAHGTYASGTVDSSPSTATYATPELTLTKSVTETYFVAMGDILHYSFNVANSGFVPLLGPVTVSDNKATDEACPAVNTVGDLDDYLDPGETINCTATYTVTAGDVTAGFVTNTASASVGSLTSNTDSKTVSIASDLTLTKGDDANNVAATATPFHWTITVSNIGTGDANFTTGQTIMSDTLPGVAGYYPQGALTVTNGSTPPTGTINCTITGTALACTASGSVTLSGGASFSITFTVTPALSGALTNTAIVDPNSNVAETNETNNTGSDTVTVIEIIAVNDSGSTVNGTNGGQSLANVLTNDTLNGNPATLGNVTLTQVSTTNVGVTLDVTTGAVNVAAGTPAGTYTVTYQICDQANPSICDTATVTVPVVVIDAVNDSGSTVSGALGGQSLANVLTNDTLNGNPATLANITLTQVSTTNAGVTLNTSTGAVSVAAGTPVGNYIVTYQICDQANPTICDTATVTVPVVVIDAVNDTGSVIDGAVGGQSVGDVLSNDTLNGNPTTLANITLTQVSTTNPGVTLDVTTGAVNVVAGTPAGSYIVTYQICDQANPTICDTATVSVPVVIINAVNDTGSTVNGVSGGQSLADVLANDTLNGTLATLTNVNLTQVSTTNSGVTLDVTSGVVSVAAGTPAGSYIVTYQICDQANPSICDTATVTVPVSAAPIVAVDDSASGVNGVTGATAVLNVFDNDTLNGLPVVPSDVTLTEMVPDPSGALTLNPDGTVDVASGTAAGTYQLTYRICEVLNATNCSTAVVRVTVATTPPPIAQDDSATTPFNTPVTLPDITANDTASGVGNSIVINTIDLDPSTSGQQTSFTDTNGNQWSVNTTTGAVTFTPALNFTGTATIPYSVQDTFGQTATANLSVAVGSPASISGKVFNDLDVNGTQGASESGIGSVKVDLYDSTGTTLIATITTSAGGSYSFNNLTPGSYVVKEIDLAGYVSTTPNSVAVTVPAGGSGTVNFGDYKLPNTALSGIIGMVFDDANANGVQDLGESALSGVTVKLKNNLGAVIATTTTDALGKYSFTNLAAGMYTVTETDPAGFVSTTLNNVGVNLSAGTTATVNFGDQTSGNAQIADPAVTKFGSPTSSTVGSIVVYTITVGNNGNTNANNVVLTDTKPSFLDIISITISPNPGLTPVISGNTFTINFGTVTPTDSYTVTVVTRVNSLGRPPGGANNASISTSSITDRTFNDAFSASLQITMNSGGGVSSVHRLPNTGFAPGVVTDLSSTPREEYVSTGDVTLEIPSLGIKIPVVGVPLKDGNWNVSWLGNQAGWLEGTAFPSWNGNSVLTSHVYLSNGLPGPFVGLSKLRFGDKIIIHAYGQKYTFEVQANMVLGPNDTSAFKHEEKPWLTLVTCKEYDQKSNTYLQRVAVRAILTSVLAE